MRVEEDDDDDGEEEEGDHDLALFGDTFCSTTKKPRLCHEL